MVIGRMVDQPAAALSKRVAAFLGTHTTLNLATVSHDGKPAVAAMFYAHDADLNLYFLSEMDTLHGQNLRANSQVAGTIHADGQDWQTIKGLQLKGRATPVPAGELAHAMAIYGRKFAFIRALLAGSGGPAALVGPLARARFYVLRPTWFRLIDNTVQFGYKEELWVGRMDATRND